MVASGGLDNALGGWGRNGFRLRGLVQGTLPVTGVTFPATAADIASGNVAPTVLTGDTIPIDVDGYVVRIDTTGGQTIADATKMQINVARSGYSTTIGSGPTLNGDVSFGTKLLRRVHPNAGSGAGSPLLASGTSFLVAHDNLIHAADTVISIVLRAGFFTGQTADITIPGNIAVRNDTIVYDKPMIRPITQPYRRCTTTATVEFIVVSGWATGGQQVARVEARAKRGASYGAWAGANTMTRSASTPASGRAPSGVALPVYSVTVDLTGLADTATRGDTIIVFRAYSFFGDQIFDSETDGDPLQANGLPTSTCPPAGLPIIKDAAGNHAPIYAWINRDGTAGGSAAIQTGTSDPGASVSYASEAAAMTAARAYNNANRGHNTTSGIVLLFRDVSGSGLGDSTTAYWQRADMSGFSDGLVPPVLASATYLSTGTTNTNCRRRSVQDNGTTASTSRTYTSVIELRGLTLDGTGVASLNTMFDGTNAAGNATTAAAATSAIILTDCDVRDNPSGAGAVLFRTGWRWDWRIEQSNCPISTGTGYFPAAFAGLMASAGGWYWSTTWTVQPLPLTALAGLRVDNIFVNEIVAGIHPDVRDAMIVHCRVDAEGVARSLVGVAHSENRVYNGRGICGLMIRKVGTFNGPVIQISADAILHPVSNLVVQYLSCDAGDGTTNNDRLNWVYGDQGYIQVIKRGVLQYSALGSINSKDDTFVAPEAPGGSGYTTGWAAATRYVRGVLRHDNNATPASRVWYQAVSTFTSGGTQATDLADISRWLNLGTVNGVAFGAQPRRNGNWRAQHAVRCFGNVAALTASGVDAGFNVSSWAGEVPWRGGAFLSADSTVRTKYFKNRTGGALSTFANRGDYRPQSLAAGDANDSPLLNRVPSGGAVMPFDLLGITRRNDGTGAAGAYERSA